MADQETLSSRPNPIPLFHPELIDMAKSRLEGFLGIQKEVIETLGSINQDLFKRMKAEAELTSEFMAKLRAVRSVPDATTACTEWASREMELLAEDGRHIITKGEKLMQAGQRLFSKTIPDTTH